MCNVRSQSCGNKPTFPPCADADLLPELAAAKAEGLPLSVETCPHYLNFAAEAVPAGDTRWGEGDGPFCGRAGPIVGATRSVHP